MKLINFFGISLGLVMLALMTSATAEAKTHISFGFNTHTVAHRPQVRPCYVENYPVYEPIIVRPGPYHVITGSRGYVPVYRERVIVQQQPRPFFSFGFFR